MHECKICNLSAWHGGGLFVLFFNVCVVLVVTTAYDNDDDNDLEIGHLHVETIRACPILRGVDGSVKAQHSTNNGGTKEKQSYVLRAKPRCKGRKQT